VNDVLKLQDRELDALREVANIGAGHAATALSQLTGRRIMIDVPKVHVSRLEEAPRSLGDAEQVVAAVLMHFLGDLTGRTLLLFDRDGAFRLADLLLSRTLGETDAFGEMEQSSIKETANILTGAYMNALSDFLGMLLLPSVPSMAVDLAGAILSSAYLNFGRDRDYVICLDTRFRFTESGATLVGHFMMIPDAASLSIILKAIRLG
jgi:chemotaxis protein CheC